MSNSNVNELNARFGVPGVVTIDAGKNGMPRVHVTAPAAEAEIYLHGAHLTQFTPSGHKPVLFVSADSHFDPSKAIRGGVPLIFPWFGPKADDPKAQMHGFARNQSWTLGEVTHGADGTVVVGLTLGPTQRSRKLWPHDFAATFTVAVGGALDMALEVVNTSAAPFQYEEALHTYLAIGDIKRTTIDGLGGRTFLDKTEHAKRKTQPPGPFTITGETDRVYLDTADMVTVADAGNGRKLVVSKTGSASTVVWNPWIAKAKAMSDFGDDEWPGMLCIETANAADNAVKLAPGARHTMRSTIAVQ
jgi:D-hexose-6-phosphate mutarotase